MLKTLVEYHHKRVCQKLLTHPQVFVISGDPIIQPILRHEYSLHKGNTMGRPILFPFSGKQKHRTSLRQTSVLLPKEVRCFATSGHHCSASSGPQPLPLHKIYGSENRIGTTCAKCRVKREVWHQMSGDILYARAAAGVNAHERADDFAVLVTIQLASRTKGCVYCR